MLTYAPALLRIKGLSMHLYMIRHAQSHVNLEEWDNGNVDAGLTDLGRQQARLLGAWMQKELHVIDALYCSTMQRARETCDPVAEALGLPIRYDDRVREIGSNRLDHTPWPNNELPQEFAEYWSTERPFSPITPAHEGSETFAHFRARVGIFVEELVRNHIEESVAVVCHGGVVEAVFDHAFNVGMWRRCEIMDHNTGVTYFRYIDHPNRETWQLYYHNRIDHLREMKDDTA